MNSPLHQVFTAALASLPRGYRQLLTLYELDGATANTLSALLGMTPSQARVELLHARRAMRQRLSDRLRVAA